MSLDRLIELAFSRTPTFEEVEQVARLEHVSVEKLLDLLARRVAERYHEGVYTFGDADAAMNHIFAWATTFMDKGLPAFAGKVFEAFDAGEFERPGVSQDEQGEALTRTLLSVCLRPDS